MIKCKNCGCRLYDDFGLGLYDYYTGEAICKLSTDDSSDHVKVRVHEEDFSENYVDANKALLKQMIAKQDEFLINFFGSREAAIEQAHLYVLEDHGTEYDIQESKLTATSNLRLRKKTPEELAENP